MLAAYRNSAVILAIPFLLGALWTSSALAADIYAQWSLARPPTSRFFEPQLQTLLLGRFEMIPSYFPGREHFWPILAAFTVGSLLLAAVFLGLLRKRIEAKRYFMWTLLIQGSLLSTSLVVSRPLALSSMLRAGPQPQFHTP